jgi:hypothetical protein
MHLGMISKGCVALLQRRVREVPDELQDAYIKLATDFLRPIMQPDEMSVREACRFARSRLGITEDEDRVYKFRMEAERWKQHPRQQQRERENA